MSIFDNPQKVLANIIAFVEGPVWSFLKPFAQALESGAFAILITAAENGVQAGFAANGQEAMALALKSFEAEVVAKGLPFIESQARALIEVALQKAKASSEAALTREPPAATSAETSASTAA